MAENKLRTAVLSVSGQNSSYAEAFFANPSVEVVAVTEDDPPPATARTTPEETQQGNRAWASEHGVPFVEDLDDVLGRADVDAVTFSSAYERRAPLVEKMASAGKHIFGDKPLTENLADCDAIIESVKRHGVRMSVGHNYRFNPAILEARQSLKVGDIGLPWAIHSEWVIAEGQQAAAIGELRNHAMYPLDAILYLVPERVQTVYALTGSYFFDNAKETGVEDLGFITMNMDRGIIATTSLGRTPHSHPNAYGGDQTIRIMGTHGMIYLDANRPGWLSAGKSGVKNLHYGPDKGYQAIDHFVQAVLNDETPMCGPQDARDTLEITLAALESAREGKVVKLPLPA